MGDHSQPPEDRGMTLIEVIAATVVVGLVAAALGSAFIVFVRNSDGIQGKLAASQSALLTTRYLPSDLQSVAPGGVTTSAFVPQCGITPDVLAVTWTDLATTPSTRYDALYHLQGTDLARTLCVDGAEEETVAVAHQVATALAVLTGDDLELTITTLGTEADPGGFTYSVFGTRRTSGP